MGGRSSVGGKVSNSIRRGDFIDSSAMNAKQINALSIEDKVNVLNGLPAGTRVYLSTSDRATTGIRYTKGEDGTWQHQGWETNQGMGGTKWNKMTSKDVVEEHLDNVRSIMKG